MKKHPQLKKFLEIEDNTICFDCGSNKADWASVNNAIVICINCCVNHRSLGVNISYVKSFTLDNWSDNQVKMMLAGGNTKLAELLDAYEIGEGTMCKELYQSKLLDYHRKQIKKSVTNDSEILIPPNKEDALIPYDQVTSINKNSSKKFDDYNDSSFRSKTYNQNYYNDNSGNIKWSSTMREDSSFNYSKERYGDNTNNNDVIINDDRYSSYNSNNNLIDLEKVDTVNLPNNLFELKHKKLEEQRNKDYGNTCYSSNDNRYASVSSDPNFRDTMNCKSYDEYYKEDDGMVSTFGKVLSGAYNRGKELAFGAKDKMEEYEVKDKIKTTGEMTIDALKYTGQTLYNIASSDTTKAIVGKTTENIGYLFNRILWGNNQYDNSKNNSNSNNVYNSNSNKDDNYDDYNYDNSGLINNSYTKSNSRYSPPRNNINNSYNSNDDDLRGNVLFKKDKDKYSNSSYIN